ncbi:MAG: DUF72 domain-containing protein [Chthoniobacteraceae bacterium]
MNRRASKKLPSFRKSARGDLRIGISGWTYPPWRGGNFYPEKWPQKRELEYASRHVNSIEINGSFYSLQRPESYAAWHAATPPGFLFSVKGGRFITHLKRLKDVEVPLANFLASGVLRLREKLGPILWQLPPQFSFDPTRLEAFFRLLPRTTSAAAALAREHDERLAGRAWTRIDRDRPLRHALEVRHPSFVTPEFIVLLRAHDIALVVADTAGKWPFMEDVTSDFLYLRLHGAEELYVSGYTTEALAGWEKKIRAWSRGETPADARLIGPRPKRRSGPRDVFVYFDNDVKVRAPFDAMTLAHNLDLGPAPGPAPDLEAISIARSQATPISADPRWNFARKPLRPSRRRSSVGGSKK